MARLSTTQPAAAITALFGTTLIASALLTAPMPQPTVTGRTSTSPPVTATATHTGTARSISATSIARMLPHSAVKQTSTLLFAPA